MILLHFGTFSNQIDLKALIPYLNLSVKLTNQSDIRRLKHAKPAVSIIYVRIDRLYFTIRRVII